jgi:DNA-binding NarL/FixJ family response regulator
VRLLLADDHDLFREAIAAMVSADGSIGVVSVADLAGVLQKLAEERFDIVLLDYQMPGMKGLEGLEKARALAGQTPVAVISGTTRRDLAEEVLARGGAGFVPKTLGVMAMLDAPPGTGSVLDDLTRREMDVLRGIREGKSNKEIARDLEVQEVTIKLHVKTLSRKLGARNRTHAAMIARDAGLQ